MATDEHSERSTIPHPQNTTLDTVVSHSIDNSSARCVPAPLHPITARNRPCLFQCSEQLATGVLWFCTIRRVRFLNLQAVLPTALPPSLRPFPATDMACLSTRHLLCSRIGSEDWAVTPWVQRLSLGLA